MKSLLASLTAAALLTVGTCHLRMIGSLTVENAEPYGHPGTPLSVVRINREADAISSVIRLSTRPTEPQDAQPGFGGCITFQSKLESGGLDRDMGHLCVQLDEKGAAEAVLWLRDENGGYHIVEKWKP